MKPIFSLLLSLALCLTLVPMSWAKSEVKSSSTTSQIKMLKELYELTGDAEGLDKLERDTKKLLVPAEEGFQSETEFLVVTQNDNQYMVESLMDRLKKVKLHKSKEDDQSKIFADEVTPNGINVVGLTYRNKVEKG